MRYTTILSLVVVVAGAACASYEGKPVPSSEAVVSAMQKVVGDVTVQADPYVQIDRQKKVFDANFTKNGVLGIFVTVGNAGAKPLLIRPSDMVLTTIDGTNLIPAAPSLVASKVEDNVGHNYWPMFFFGIVGAMAQGSAESDAREKRAADYRVKHFTDMTIGKGESASGFVFFIAKKENPKFARTTLKVRVVDTAEGTSLDIPLSFSKR